jgi:hypothetical protein
MNALVSSPAWSTSPYATQKSLGVPRASERSEVDATVMLEDRGDT